MAGATCSYPSCPGYPMPLDARVCRGCGAPAHHLCQIAFETTHGLEETLLKWCPDCRLRDAGVVDRPHGRLHAADQPRPGATVARSLFQSHSATTGLVPGRGSFADVGDSGSDVSDCGLDLSQPTDSDSDMGTDSAEAERTDSAKAEPTDSAQVRLPAGGYCMTVLANHFVACLQFKQSDLDLNLTTHTPCLLSDPCSSRLG